jgi:hypothetical protein
MGRIRKAAVKAITTHLRQGLSDPLTFPSRSDGTAGGLAVHVQPYDTTFLSGRCSQDRHEGPAILEEALALSGGFSHSGPRHRRAQVTELEKESFE